MQRQKWSRGQVEARLANLPRCLIGMRERIISVANFRRLDPAAHAQALMDAWHKRLAAGESARPPPTIATAIAAEYERLDVYCDGCRYKTSIPWPLIRRPPETPLADLAGILTCKRCGPKGPLPKMLGVSRQRDAPGYIRKLARLEQRMRGYPARLGRSDL